MNPQDRIDYDLFVVPLNGDPTPVAIVASQSLEVEPQLSPDNRWLAYCSLESGRYEVFVEPFPTTGQRTQVSSTSGRQPMWSHDGRELYFVTDGGILYTAPVGPGPQFRYETPRPLFELRAEVSNARNSYIPAPDGKRFLVNMNVRQSANPINVVMNWPATVRP